MYAVPFVVCTYRAHYVTAVENVLDDLHESLYGNVLSIFMHADWVWVTETRDLYGPTCIMKRLTRVIRNLTDPSKLVV
ncbi:hypothetical protein DMJ13_10620 [halophilic archaeon]|nr:hypothetical protein DMJ13_10620 [halophilic archaeon]